MDLNPEEEWDKDSQGEDSEGLLIADALLVDL